MIRFIRSAALCILILVPAMLGQTARHAPPGPVTGVGNFIHVVADLDKSIEFYRDGIGLELNGAPTPRPYMTNGPVSNLYDAPGELRFATLKMPVTDMNVELVEFKDVEHHPVRPRLEDPGATELMLTVRDLNAMLARLQKMGA